MHSQTLSVDLAELQSGQQRHDEAAHREILDLSKSRRLSHYTLHFAEYAGTLFKARRSGDQEVAARVLTDSLIIALACANTLEVDLQGECSGFTVVHASYLELLLQFVEVVGEMAKACETFDHPAEGFSSITALQCTVRRMTALLLMLSTRMEMDPAMAVVGRWRAVENQVTSTRAKRPAREKPVSEAA